MDGFAFDANRPARGDVHDHRHARRGCAPFSIGIYESSDGLHTDNLVGTIDVAARTTWTETDDLSPGTHTLESPTA